MVKLIDGEMMSVEKQPDLDVKEDVLKFGKGNLISTIEECLKEHQVEISDGKNVVPMYLIMGSAKSSLSKDFIDVYGDELS